MIPKPRHLGKAYAEIFCDEAVVSAYRHRPPYPPRTFTVLAELMGDRGGPVLDIGCGRGDRTVGLSHFASRVDAIDPSARMLNAARKRVGADRPQLRWIEATLEEARLDGPYALITAGASLHWTEWDVSLPRLAGCLMPGAYLAIVDRCFRPPPFQQTLLELTPRFSTNQEYAPYDLVDELVQRVLFQPEGRAEIEMLPFRQTIDDFVEALHSANGFSRERMTREAADEFDALVRSLARPHAVGDSLPSAMGAVVQYGFPRGVGGAS